MSKESRKPSITDEFGRIFEKIKDRERFASPPLQELQERMFEALVAAALAKCVQFNAIVNRPREHLDETFAFVSSLRGICEDLIVLSYASRMEAARRGRYIQLLSLQTQADGADVQEAFFHANNPYQPVYGQRNHPMLGSHKNSGERLRSRSAIAHAELKNFWISGKPPRRRGPTVKEMALEVGLEFTYNYIYFAASNFVHFNPQALMKMGWGNGKDPFKFSVHVIGPYYKSLASFYGSILFIGFHSAFGDTHLSSDAKSDVDQLIQLIGMVPRWPEVITFEEMNEPVPLYLLSHALRKASPNGAPAGILEEVRQLGGRIEKMQT